MKKPTNEQEKSRMFAELASKVSWLMGRAEEPPLLDSRVEALESKLLDSIAESASKLLEQLTTKTAEIGELKELLAVALHSKESGGCQYLSDSDNIDQVLVEGTYSVYGSSIVGLDSFKSNRAFLEVFNCGKPSARHFMQRVTGTACRVQAARTFDGSVWSEWVGR
ncbi:MAG: hypothetical protein R8M45_11585 [Ghiorsea sp.]